MYRACTLAVLDAAVQRLRDWDVVFRAEDGVFEAQPVVLGRRDGSHAEVVSGLAPGQRYAASGSFDARSAIDAKRPTTHQRPISVSR